MTWYLPKATCRKKAHLIVIIDPLIVVTIAYVFLTYSSLTLVFVHNQCGTLLPPSI